MSDEALRAEVNDLIRLAYGMVERNIRRPTMFEDLARDVSRLAPELEKALRRQELEGRPKDLDVASPSAMRAAGWTPRLEMLTILSPVLAALRRAPADAQIPQDVRALIDEAARSPGSSGGRPS